MEAMFVNFRRIFAGVFIVVFSATAFHKDTFNCEIVYQKKRHLIICHVIQLFYVQGK